MKYMGMTLTSYNCFHKEINGRLNSVNAFHHFILIPLSYHCYVENND